MHSYKTLVSPSLELEKSPKVALIIVNPNSGQRKGPRALAIIQPIFEKEGIECRVFKTTHAGHCREICEKEDLSDVDILVPIGGDGTLHEACNGLLSRSDGAAEKITIAVIPAGSGNTFAYDIRLVDVAEAAHVAVAGKYRKVDAAVITAVDKDGNALPDKPKVYSINLAGWALPSKVMRTANAMRCMGCGAWYDFAINKYILTNDRYKAKIIYKNEQGESVTIERDIAMMSVQNTVHAGDKLPLAPEAKVDDGVLDLAIMTNRNLFTNLITFNLTKRGLHTKRKQVTLVKCTEVLLLPADDRLSGNNTVNVDGELTSYTPCLIKVMPGALRVFCAA